uniref:Uncharacterized protein n=1 Tax=Siphoviridae sp. ctnpt50 TaxID=2827941 RepID=A0A8S5SDE7_9CAUD|nr:MAG TPA: hypothetical protein [Siphoviridae sp. ctnpt50]
MKKLAVCECCGNIFMIGDRVWKYRGDKLCSEECARKAEFLGKQGKWKNTTDEKDESNAKMKEIKLTIDGEVIKLTDEQLKMLGVESNKRINPFETVVKFEDYYSVEKNNEIYAYMDTGSSVDNQLYTDVNYFNDKDFAKQVALHQLLYRKLLKYAYDNEFEDEEWNGNNMHAYIIYNSTKKNYDVRWTRDEKEPCTVYFKTPTRATAALNEVVMPFVKEHPEFVW